MESQSNPLKTHFFNVMLFLSWKKYAEKHFKRKEINN